MIVAWIKALNQPLQVGYEVIWGKVFKSGPSKICGRQALKIFTCSTLEYLDQMCLSNYVKGSRQKKQHEIAFLLSQLLPFFSV